ncbi:ThuA domain-containing protein [Rhodopirellula sallentina]|nr:ThuA domain-containing protein [Rhodopirellula sallentina]
MSTKFLSVQVFRFAAIAALLCVATTNIASADDRLVIEPAEGTANGKHIVLISGDEEYRSEESCPMFAKILSQHHGFKCTVLFAIDSKTGVINPYDQGNIPGMDTLADADLCVLTTRFRKLPDDQMKPFLDYLKAGKPLVAYRTATHAFKGGNYGGFEWKNFGIKVLGENWHSHHGKHKVEGARGLIVRENADHPILRGVKDIYTPSDVYGVVHLDEDEATVLLRGQVLKLLDPAAPPVTDGRNDPMMPYAWVKPYSVPSGETGQAFTTTAGGAVDFRCEDLRRLIVNACLHLSGEEVPGKADVSFVDPYQPSFFGFLNSDYFQERGLHPEDFRLGHSATTADPPPTYAPEPATAE